MANPEIKNIVIAGGTGLIGKNTAAFLRQHGYNVYLLTRDSKSDRANTLSWDPEKKIIDTRLIEIADVIINLAGAGIADKHWTASRKRLIINSRLFTANLLFETLSSNPHHVKLLINASAIGIYGNTGQVIMHENSPPGKDFLSQTCQLWENAAQQFTKLNIRTVIFRLGLVLSKKGGVLPEIMKPLKYGIAPVFGNGSQYQSWIHIDDVSRMILKAIEDVNMKGVYNAVAPEPITNLNFMKLLANITAKKYFFIKIPEFLMKLFLGQMAVVVTSGTKVSSKKIESAGFIFTYSQAQQAFKNLLN